MTQSSSPRSLTCRMHPGSTVHPGQKMSDRAMPRTCYERWGIGNLETPPTVSAPRPRCRRPPPFAITSFSGQESLCIQDTKRELMVLGNRKQPKKVSTCPPPADDPPQPPHMDHDERPCTSTHGQRRPPPIHPSPTNEERPRTTTSSDPRRDRSRQHHIFMTTMATCIFK